MKGKPKGSYSFSPGFAEERDPASNNIRFQSSFSFSFGALPVLHARWLWRPAFFNCVCTNRWEVIRKRESWRCLGGLSESKIERQREGKKNRVAQTTRSPLTADIHTNGRFGLVLQPSPSGESAKSSQSYTVVEVVGVREKEKALEKNWATVQQLIPTSR